MPDDNTGNWRDGFSDEVKNAEEIKNFKTVEDLAKSHIEANKLLSQRYEGIGKDDGYDEFSAKAEKFFKIPKKAEEYKATENEAFDKLGHKYKLHPELQLKPMKTEIEEHYKKSSESEASKKVEFWRQETEKLTKEVSNKDEVIGKAFAKLGTTREKFEEALGDIKHHPEVNKLLLHIGKTENKTKDQNISTTAGGEGGLDTSMQEKFQYVRQHLDNFKSPYYNKTQAEHSEVKAKVDRFVKELSQYEHKKGVRFLSQNQT